MTGCAKAPQLGADEAGFTAADALWTAVSAKNGDLLETSAAEIRSLNQVRKVSDEAFGALDEIIRKARAGDWCAARAELRRFIQEQKRGPADSGP